MHFLFWASKPKPLTALQLATIALEDCRIEHLDAMHKMEYYTAQAAMLKKRDARLVDDIRRLSSKDSQPEDNGSV